MLHFVTAGCEIEPAHHIQQIRPRPGKIMARVTGDLLRQPVGVRQGQPIIHHHPPHRFTPTDPLSRTGQRRGGDLIPGDLNQRFRCCREKSVHCAANGDEGATRIQGTESIEEGRNIEGRVVIDGERSRDHDLRHSTLVDFETNAEHVPLATLAGDGSDINLMFDADTQAFYCDAEPTMFAPVPGGWGRMGATRCDLGAVDEATLLGALTSAHALAAPKTKAAKTKARKT